METWHFGWPAQTLTRNRTAIIALAAIALGCSFYYVHDQIRSFHSPQNNEKQASSGLRRSNARRQRRPTTTEPPPSGSCFVGDDRAAYVTGQPWGSTPISLEFLYDTNSHHEHLGRCTFALTDRHHTTIIMKFFMPTVDDLRSVHPQAPALRQDLEEVFLMLYFFRHLPPSDLTPEQNEVIVRELSSHEVFSRQMIWSVIEVHQSQQLQQVVRDWTTDQEALNEEITTANSRLINFPCNEDQVVPGIQIGEGYGSVTDNDNGSEHSWRNGAEVEEGRQKSEHNLLSLLYRIGEDKAIKDGYVHRRVTCNACNAMPIRGIRYHCANCWDYDLCEQCEAFQTHDKTHVFYKIRIPATYSQMPKRPAPVWYPGTPNSPAIGRKSLEKDEIANICKRTGFQKAETEALWEQYKCLASTEWPEDSLHYGLAIDRQSFDSCFVPHSSLRTPAPNLIYDRLFAFYDQNDDGLIGFTEFIDGVASLTQNNANKRLRSVFKGYDINNDGFIDRKDFLRMFRAYYDIIKEQTRDLVHGMNDEDVEEEGPQSVILSSQPISSIFKGRILPEERPSNGEGKVRDDFGDLVISDGRGMMDDYDLDSGTLYNTINDKIATNQHLDLLLQHIHDLYNAAWPHDSVSPEDAQAVLGMKVSLSEVTDVKIQRAIQRVTHARVARLYQKQTHIRVNTLRERERRRIFYLDDEDGSAPSRAPRLKKCPDTGMTRPVTSLQSGYLQRLKVGNRTNSFWSYARLKAQNLGWPLHDNLVDDLAEMILDDLTASEIAESLEGYATNGKFGTAREFVDSLFAVLEECALNKVCFGDNAECKDEHDLRSRATSTATSSNSRPIDKRLGGVRDSNSARVAGQEVFYQYTQEAMNELLDLMFRLREDLSLVVLQTKRARDQCRVETAASIANPLLLEERLNLYQRRWRSGPDRHVVPTQYPAFLWNEARDLYPFLKWVEEGQMNGVTANLCPYCSRNGLTEWIPLAGNCLRCRKPSSIMKETKSTPPEKCFCCFKMGKESSIGGDNGSWFCTECGEPSQFYIGAKDIAHRIIKGDFSGQDSLARSRDDTRADASRDSSDHANTSLPPEEAFIDLDVAVMESVNQKSIEQMEANRGLPSRSPPPDPTLPQNRPSNSDTGQEKGSQPWNKDTLRYLAALNLLEYEDKTRGGPGRLNFQEFAEVMQGQKGKALAFVGTWLDMAIL
ncbi:hypothetical protein ACLMJK_006121 [Lecanora helva]